MDKRRLSIRCTSIVFALAALGFAARGADAHWDHDVIPKALITDLSPSTSGSSHTALGVAGGLLYTSCTSAAELWIWMSVDNNVVSTHKSPAPVGESNAAVLDDNTEVVLTTGTHQVRYWAQGLTPISVFDYPPMWDHQETMIVP